ncbi:MAG: cation transporter [Desulfobulbaceae bacterium]|nr:cation transporter [Desulfobulbaceae bacterium]
MPTIRIKGMSCQHCVGSVTKALLAIDGITKVTIDLATGEARYEEEKPVATASIKDAVAGIGFEVT